MTTNLAATNIFSVTDPTLKRLSSIDATLEKAKSGLSAQKLKDIDGAAKDFESVFVSEMLKPMFDTVQTDSEFGGGQAEDTWKSMMVEQYGKKIVQAGGIGLADDIKSKMIEMQAAAQSSDQPAATTTPAAAAAAMAKTQGGTKL